MAFCAFGPSQSFVAALQGCGASSRNFSLDLASVINGEHSKSLSFVAFVGDQKDGDASTTGAVSQAYVGYHKKRGLMGAGHLYCPPNNALALPALEEWIKKQEDKTEGMVVVCNGKGGYWARSSKGKTTGENLPSEVWQWVKDGNPHGAEVMVALGVNDSYIVSYEDGHVVWDLKGAYDALDRKLEQVLGQSTGLRYASLNPYHADEYFCIFKDSSCTFSFPSMDAFRDFEKMLIFASNLRVIIDSPTLKSSTDAMPAPVPAAGGNGKSSLGKQIMVDAFKDVAKKAEENDMEATGAFIGNNL